jgi:hypothetical protein
VLAERLERLAALRGDVVKGLPATAWATNLEGFDRDLLLRAVIEATRTLILPDWEGRRPDDRRPHAAIEAAEAWLSTKSDEAADAAKSAAKECTAARSETFGNDHRVPEAARACAWAVNAKDNEHIWDALVAIEGELLARIQLASDYQALPAQRRSILAVVRRVLEPPVQEASPVDGPPVPYAASGHFVVGQRLVHKMFGDLVVTAAGDKWIDVTLPDGSTKRLAQKPK